MTRDALAAFTRVLVDEWVRGGVTHAVVAPGSRSAPLALALADDGRVAIHVVIDERSAAFVAVGIGRGTGRPAVVLTTSGTAAANLHPALLEAHHGRVPLIVCTADRPPELRDVGAPQTIDQVRLFGAATRWFVDAEVPTDRPGAPDAWRELGARSVAAAVGPPAGPVHLNLPFREPLLPTGAPLVPAPGRADGAPWTTNAPRPAPAGVEPAAIEPAVVEPAVVDAIVERVRRHERGVFVAGWGAAVSPATAQRFVAASGWPLLADPLSGLGAVPGAVHAYEAMLRADGFAAAHAPTAAIRVGAPLTSAIANRWLAQSDDTVVVGPDLRWCDPDRRAAALVGAEPEPLLRSVAAVLETATDGRSAWRDGWDRASDRAVRAQNDVIDGWVECSEPRTAREVVAALPADSALVVASSMPIRDVEAFAPPRAGVPMIANRGVNGIDGFVSTALGVALGRAAPTVALSGDLSFLHDGGGLLAARTLGASVVFVVVDNGGGGIFSFLPQADLPHHFETLFATPPGADLPAVAAVHGFTVTEVHAPAHLGVAIAGALAAGGVHLVRVGTDRSRNVEHHREVWRAVASALRPWSEPAAPG